MDSIRSLGRLPLLRRPARWLLGPYAVDPASKGAMKRSWQIAKKLKSKGYILDNLAFGLVVKKAWI